MQIGHIEQRTPERENAANREHLEDGDGSRRGEFAKNVGKQQVYCCCREDTRSGDYMEVTE